MLRPQKLRSKHRTSVYTNFCSIPRALFPFLLRPSDTRQSLRRLQSKSSSDGSTGQGHYLSGNTTSGSRLRGGRLRSTVLAARLGRGGALAVPVVAVGLAVSGGGRAGGQGLGHGDGGGGSASLDGSSLTVPLGVVSMFIDGLDGGCMYVVAVGLTASRLGRAGADGASLFVAVVVLLTTVLVVMLMVMIVVTSSLRGGGGDSDGGGGSTGSSLADMALAVVLISVSTTSYKTKREVTYVVTVRLAAVGLSRRGTKVLGESEGDETRDDSGGELHIDDGCSVTRELQDKAEWKVKQNKKRRTARREG